jgi:hypothetical protein
MLPDHTKILMLFLSSITFIGTGCTVKEISRTDRPPERYMFLGKISNESGSAANSQLACYSDTGVVKRAYPDPDLGTYRLELTFAEARRVRSFQVVSWDGIVTEFEFDERYLRDSLINLDFQLRTLPKPYEVLMTTTPHTGGPTQYDTIWLDLSRRRTTKTNSDSVWRRVPLRDRRRK